MNYQRVNYPNGYKKIMQPNQMAPCKKKWDDGPTTKLPTNPNNQVLNLFPIDEGYVKGTIFRGLYNPYKNHLPIQPALDNERERLLFEVGKYNFGMIEMQFYLNNFPNDQEALKTFNEFRREFLRAKNNFEERFGALSIESNQLERSPWNWTQTPSAWEGGL